MVRSRTACFWIRIFHCSAFALFLGGCGPIILENDVEPGGEYRRLFVHDAAANDSLKSAILGSGVKFVLQPGALYELSLENVGREGDQIILYHYSNGKVKKYRTFTGINTGMREYFGLVSDRAIAQYFMARVRGGDGNKIAFPFGRISLAGKSTSTGNTLSAQLLFVNKLKGLRTAADKAAFAKVFLDTLSGLFQDYGVTLTGKYTIVSENDEPFVMPFGYRIQYSIPGDRDPNSVNIYLVDSIDVAGGRPDQYILGFAPREAEDMARQLQNRVVLSNQAGPENLAYTAAHELGHFFGLRHTWATEADLKIDDDVSNLDDGFASTKPCADAIGVAFVYAEHSQPYCLRVASSNCPRTCDLENLMHPFQCQRTIQGTLTPEQKSVLLKNIALLKQ